MLTFKHKVEVHVKIIHMNALTMPNSHLVMISLISKNEISIQQLWLVIWNAIWNQKENQWIFPEGIPIKFEYRYTCSKFFIFFQWIYQKLLAFEVPNHFILPDFKVWPFVFPASSRALIITCKKQKYKKSWWCWWVTGLIEGMSSCCQQSSHHYMEEVV